MSEPTDGERFDHGPATGPTPKITEITDAMIEAARRAADGVGIIDPYGAMIRDYTNYDGEVDRDALREADQRAEIHNRAAWMAVIQAALDARQANQ
jgi:hypothetical protein